MWRGDRLLITRRLANVHLGGCWELPGGKCRPGEALEDCVVREVLEEVGREVVPVGRRPVIEYDYRDRAVRLHPFDCRCLGGEPTAGGCAAWRWVRVGELSGYEFPAANAELIAGLGRSGSPELGDGE